MIMVFVLPFLWICLRCMGIRPGADSKSKCNGYCLSKAFIYSLLILPALVATLLIFMDALVLRKDIREGLRLFGTSANTSFGFMGSSISTRPRWNSVSILIPRFFDRLFNLDSQRNYYFNGPVFHLPCLLWAQKA